VPGPERTRARAYLPRAASGRRAAWQRSYTRAETPEGGPAAARARRPNSIGPEPTRW